jgi:hypothetical protein
LKSSFLLQTGLKLFDQPSAQSNWAVCLEYYIVVDEISPPLATGFIHPLDASCGRHMPTDDGQDDRIWPYWITHCQALVCS